ncbi:MAG TPA: YfiR family protein [Pyrinomonadaceae bacterium]|nr:YfiR family protein [Pyrinomonadaceae bacterium]
MSLEQTERAYTLVAQVTLRSLLLLFFLVSIGSSNVAAQAPNEYRVKAAFILNFARFVEWPADAYSESGVLVVGIIGDNPFGGSLDQLNGNTVNGRRISIRRFKAGDYLKGCQILFVGSSERNRLGKILDSVKGGSVLTIGELPQFNQAGGVIKFVIDDYKVRFEINAGAAGHARLRVSSKLLALSKGGRN